jgi:hypothetical protein
MSAWPPRRALTFPTVSEASQTLPVRPAGEPERRFPSDEDLMSRLQSNDASALEVLFHRYARLVFRIARGVIRDSGEAEDVVQEAFFVQRAGPKTGSCKSRSIARWTEKRI